MIKLLCQQKGWVYKCVIYHLPFFLSIYYMLARLTPKIYSFFRDFYVKLTENRFYLEKENKTHYSVCNQNASALESVLWTEEEGSQWISAAGALRCGTLYLRLFGRWESASPLLHFLLRRAQHQVFSYLLSFWTFGLTCCSSPWLISSRKGGGLSLPDELIWWLQGSSGMRELWSQALWGWGYKPDFLLPGWGDYGVMHKVSMSTFFFIQA